MGRRQILIVYPRLNDCGGDLTKDWYVEWSYRVPGVDKPVRQREYGALNLPTAKQRYDAAQLVIEKKTEWLKSGAYIDGTPERVFVDELKYRQEAKLFAEATTKKNNSRNNLSDFLRVIRQKVNDKTYMNYQSKMRIFNSFLENQKLDNCDVKQLKREHILKFATLLAEKGSSRLTIKKYIQIIHSYFDYELEAGNIEFNPVYKMPLLGKVVDMAAVPFAQDERKRLREAIEPIDPQLWLACEIQYYCAIRPGTELRLMKINWIDFDRNKIRVPIEESKSNRADYVDIPQFLVEKLAYLQTYSKDMYVFGKYGMPGPVPLGKNTLRNRFNRFREACNVSDDRKFYSWKHTGAIQMLDNGLQPHDLKDHLRHKSYATTEVYIKKRAGNLKGKVDRFASEI